MAINKVIVNGETKLDLTADTATVNNVQEGFTFHDATGILKTGVAKVSGVDGYYIKKVFDDNEVGGNPITVDVSTNGKYCFFYISNYSNNLEIYQWHNGDTAGNTVYVMSTQPITYVNWYENSTSSSS